MWTRAQLLMAYDAAGRGHDLAEIARRIEHTAEQVDLALWTMIGRTVQDALAILNARTARAAV